MSEIATLIAGEWAPSPGQYGPGMTLVRGAGPVPGGFAPIPPWVERANFGTTYTPNTTHARGLWIGAAEATNFAILDEFSPSTNRRIMRGSVLVDTVTTSVAAELADAPSMAQYDQFMVSTHGRHAAPRIVSETAAGLYPAGVALHLGTSQPWAKFVTSLGPHLILANLSNTGGGTNPNNAAATIDDSSIWISRIDAIQYFETDTSNRSGVFPVRDQCGPITAIVGGQSWGAIFKDRSVWRMDMDAGSSYFPLALRQIPTSLGTLYPRSVVVADTDIYFWAVNGPAVFDGQRVTDLGKDALATALLDPYWGLTSSTESVYFNPLYTVGSIPLSVVGWWEPAMDWVCWAYTNGSLAGDRYKRILVLDRRTGKTSIIRSTNWRLQDGTPDAAPVLDARGVGRALNKGASSKPQRHPLCTTRLLASRFDDSRFITLETEREGSAGGAAQFFDEGRVILRWPYDEYPGADGRGYPYTITRVRLLVVDSARGYLVASDPSQLPPGRAFTLVIRSRNCTQGSEDDTTLVTTSTFVFGYGERPNADGWFELPSIPPAARLQSVDVSFDMDTANLAYPGADLGIVAGVQIMVEPASSGGV